MTAELLDGKALSASVREELTEQVSDIVARGNRAPALDVILVGEDAASQVYVGSKEKACAKVGIRGQVHRFDVSTSAEELRRRIVEINQDADIDGLLVQLPLPAQIDPALVRQWIDPAKDVDGLHPENVGLLASGEPRFVPCTPAGCLELLRRAGVEIAGRRALEIGRSLIVARPMANLLSTKGIDATVTVSTAAATTWPLSAERRTSSSPRRVNPSCSAPNTSSPEQRWWMWASTGSRTPPGPGAIDWSGMSTPRWPRSRDGSLRFPAEWDP